MERAGKHSTIARIEQERLSAIIRTQDQTLAREAIEAAVSGGFRVVEFTLTTPGALELVSMFAKRRELLVGAGTVMTPETARQAVNAGAAFLVSPIADGEVIAEATRLDVPMIPGCYTPTEMETAHRLGASLIKVFPAPAGGVSFIEAVRAPLPHLRLFPTAGFTAENFTDFLDAGCVGVGFVRPLFDPEDLRSRNFDAIRKRAVLIMKRLSDWRATRG
jgi:2-dehydro-3-deoxyphosphogluconate aldolase/(4S)-4-hydroxy-2-oxoglutarate aldolase